MEFPRIVGGLTFAICGEAEDYDRIGNGGHFCQELCIVVLSNKSHISDPVEPVNK